MQKESWETSFHLSRENFFLSTKGTVAKFVGPTRYDDAPIYKAVLKDRKGKALFTWPQNTDVNTDLYRVSGYTSQYKSDLAAVKEMVLKNDTATEDYSLDLYYVSKDKARIKVDFKYLDSNGNVVTPSNLPTGIHSTSAKIGDTWRLSSAAKAAYKQGAYYYNSYKATYYEPNGLAVTQKTDPATATV